MKIIDVYANTTEEVLKHKLTDGKRSENSYCYWKKSSFRSRFWELMELLSSVKDQMEIESFIWKDYVYPGEKKNARNVSLNMDVRLHMVIDGHERGYFSCFGCDKKIKEIWFHSEDWVEKR